MMKYNISIFLFALIFFTGCSDEDESLTNSFHSTHAGTVWFSNSNNMWWRINMDSDDDYMNGNLHLDIAHLGPYKYAKACWGASGKSYRRKFAPEWLSSAFDNRV